MLVLKHAYCEYIKILTQNILYIFITKNYGFNFVFLDTTIFI